GLRPVPFAGAGALALITGGPSLVAALRAVRAPRGRSTWLLLAACALLLLVEAPTWFAPPVGGDQEKYHLVYPRLYALAGGLLRPPWTLWGQQQWLENFLFAIAFALRGDVLARLLNAFTGVMAALALATLGRRHLGQRLGAVAGAVFFTTGMCWSQMTRAGTDTSVGMYAALAVSALLDWATAGRPSDPPPARILAGPARG